MKPNLLLYYRSNRRTVAMETLILEMNKYANIKVLTIEHEGEFHEFLKSKGICIQTIPKVKISLISHIYYVLHLILFCWKNKIDVVWSHLHPCNFYTVCAQFFIKSKVIIFRHHFHAQVKDKGLEVINRNERIMEWIIARLSKQIVVPSSEVFQGMVQYEKIDSKKISILPYIYDFDQYKKPNDDFVKNLIDKYNAKMRIVIASRMIEMKRHFLVLPILNKMIKEGLDIQVFILDDGELRPKIENFITKQELHNRVHLFGFVNNLIDYIAASNVLLHPSATEASSSLIKEAGLLEKIVIACRGVGDFDDYILHGENGFLVESPNEALEFEKYLREIYFQLDLYLSMGVKLKKSVLGRFSVNQDSVLAYKKFL